MKQNSTLTKPERTKQKGAAQKNRFEMANTKTVGWLKFGIKVSEMTS